MNDAGSDLSRAVRAIVADILARDGDAAQLPPGDACLWYRVGRMEYVTQCGRDVLLARRPMDRGWSFCPFCGGPISDQGVQ